MPGSVWHRGRCVSASMTMPLVRARYRLVDARGACALARARVGGDFSRHFYSAVSALPWALRVTCALRAVLDRFPAIVLASSRSRTRRVPLRGGRSGANPLILLLIRLHQFVALVVYVVLKSSLLPLLPLQLIQLWDVEIFSPDAQ